MEVRTRAPLDLHAMLAATALLLPLALLLPDASPLRVVLGLPLVLFFPGYALVAALFPAARSATGGRVPGAAVRAGLAFGLSLALVPLLGLALDATPWKLRPAPVLLSLAVFVGGVGAVALARRARVPVPLRPEFALRLRAPSWSALAPADKALAVLAVLTLLAAAGAVAYAALAPPPGETFTEFSLLGADGTAEGLPARLAANETARLLLGVRNHEGAATAYVVEPVALRMEEGPDGPREAARAPLSPLRLEVPAGGTVETPYDLRLPWEGPTKVVFELRRGDGQEAYRTLHLWVNADGSGVSP